MLNQVKMLNPVYKKMQQFSAWIARKTSSFVMFEHLFQSLLRFSRHPLRAPSTEWCETWYAMGDCSFPYGQGRCRNCRSHSPCPQGYQPSFAYNYTTTGCWCVTRSPYGTRICCDCTPERNNPHHPHQRDCYCPHDVVNDSM